ncbi:hypothetical protein DFH09DRAFT_1316494 [Mycena vulgaris]|nr:hypothetical protein DFH09DRAFT_1316494 [Mycena vulgaris]
MRARGGFPRFRRCSDCIAACAFLAGMQRFAPPSQVPACGGSLDRGHAHSERVYPRPPPMSSHRIASPIESDGRNTSLYSFRVSYVHRVAIDAYVRLLLSLGRRRREQEGKKER